MGIHYVQLSLYEREVIGRLLAADRSVREIARTLARSPSTISREIRRNGRATKRWPGGYAPARAHELTARRRDRGHVHKLARQPALRDHVRDRLAMGWSPEQIAGRLALEHGGTVVSHESIYRYIYHRTAQKDYAWHRLLARAKFRRGRRGRNGGSPVDRIRARVPLGARPAAALDRGQPGHWEADLMQFRRPGQVVLVAHERASRFTWITRQPSKAAQGVVDSLERLFRPLARTLRRSVTFDNGTEFSYHYRLNAELGMATFFCDPHAPWQKGGVENAIGRLRRALPRKTDLAEISEQHLDELVRRYNHTPRRCLGFRTPAEVFRSYAEPGAPDP